MLFNGQRVRLRKMLMDDTALYHSWRNDPEVMQFTLPVLDVFTYSDTEKFVQRITEADNAKSYVIEEKDSDQPIGVTALTNIDVENRNAECIIDLGDKNTWGKGLGREAFQLLLDYAFLEMNLHKVYLRVFSFNERAIRLYQKLGFQTEGELKEQIYRNGSWHHVLYMGLLKRDYVDRPSWSVRCN